MTETHINDDSEREQLLPWRANANEARQINYGTGLMVKTKRGLDIGIIMFFISYYLISQ